MCVTHDFPPCFLQICAFTLQDHGPGLLEGEEEPESSLPGVVPSGLAWYGLGRPS